MALNTSAFEKKSTPQKQPSSSGLNLRAFAGGTTLSSPIELAKQAIAKIESGGNYAAIGPKTVKGQRAYGKYQVMDFNIPLWTKEALGKALTPQQFLKNPTAQEKVFEHRFGSYMKKYGSAEKAAKVWFGGPGALSNPNARDILGTTSQSYADKFSSTFGKPRAPSFDPSFVPVSTGFSPFSPTKTSTTTAILPKPEELEEPFVPPPARLTNRVVPNTELRAGKSGLTQMITNALPGILRRPFSNIVSDISDGLFGNPKDRAVVREFKKAKVDVPLTTLMETEGFMPFLGRSQTDQIEHLANQLEEKGVKPDRASSLAFYDVFSRGYAAPGTPQEERKKQAEARLKELAVTPEEKKVITYARLGQAVGGSLDAVGVLPVGKLVPKLGRGLDTLAAEARKYKSAEEFVRAQQPVYHGTNAKFDVFDTGKHGTNIKSEDIGIAFTNTKEEAGGYGKVKEAYLDFRNPKVLSSGDIVPAIWYDAEAPNVAKEARKAGHDGLIIESKRGQKMFVAFDNTRIKTKSQLTSLYNQVMGKGDSLSASRTDIPSITIRDLPIQNQKAGEIPYRKLRGIADDMNAMENPRTRLQMLNLELSFIEDAASNNPARSLVRYISRSTGKLPELTGKEAVRSVNTGKVIKNSKFGRKGDDIITELGFKDEAQAQEALDAYLKQREKIKEIRAEIVEVRKRRSLTLKGERLMQIARKDRRQAFRALRERYLLTDSELAQIRRGKDLSIMSSGEFERFMIRAEELASEIAEKSAARIELEDTIQNRELRRWENIRDLLKLPPSFADMTAREIRTLNEVLSKYKTGDEFLPVRMMETLPNTRLREVRTIREVMEILAKETDLSVEEVSKLKPTEFHRYMGDHALSRQHPFYSQLVFMKNKAFLEANARIIQLSDEADRLIKEARKSKPRGISDRLVPADKNIVKWLESSRDERAILEKNMTSAEIRASQWMDDIFKNYYEYLVKKHAEKKFSRFEDQYFPHVRRGFLEAWKEDGILKAFKEMRDKFKQDQKYLNILDERTKEILPYEKWIGFTQFRTDELVPTVNAHRAFESYVTALERGRHLDALIPEVMAYVHALSPRQLSPRGIELDTSLKRFVKEWVNANKGRVPRGFFEPGGKMDWTLRSSVALTRILDLGFNFTTQLAAPVGEQIMNLTMLKPKAYAEAIRRRNTAQGRAIIRKYQNFTGRTFFDEMSKAANNAGDRLMGGMFAIFSGAVKSGNNIFLLGKMTPEEFASGAISTDRLARLMVEMNKYRAVKGVESIMGRTGEAEAFKQYKNWAIPAVRATATNAHDLYQLIKNKGAKAALTSDAGKELFYSVGLGTAIAVGAYGYFTELGEKKDRSFVENVQYKAMRDALSIFGAFDLTLWSEIRIASFFKDLSEALKASVLMEKYKTTGELKGPAQLQRTLTPSIVKQVVQDSASRDNNEDSGKVSIPSIKIPEINVPSIRIPSLSI